MKNGKFFTQFPNPVFLVLGTLCTGLRNEDKEDNRDKDDKKNQENKEDKKHKEDKDKEDIECWERRTIAEV